MVNVDMEDLRRCKPAFMVAAAWSEIDCDREAGGGESVGATALSPFAVEEGMVLGCPEEDGGRELRSGAIGSL